MHAKRDRQNLYTDMPVGRAVITLAIPTVLSQIITVVYNMVDAFFIGQLNDPAQMAAATLAMPPFIMLVGFGNLFGIGGASLISRSLGAGNRQRARQTASFAIWGCAVLALVYGLVFVVFKSSVLPLLGAKATTFDYAYDFLFWTVTVGAVPSVLSVCLSHLVRSEGLAQHAAIGVAVGVLSNIALDPLFIFALNMQITGAAVATALGNTISALYLVVVIWRRRRQSTINASPRCFTMGQGIAREVVLVGLPNFIMNLMGVVSNTVLNSLMASYSDAAIAGIGIAKRVDMLTMAVAIGMTQGVLSLIAYNYAANNFERMRKSIRTMLTYTLVLSFITTAGLLLFAAPVSRLFMADAATVAYSQYFIQALSVICPLQAVTMSATTALQAIGRKTGPLVLSFMRKGTIDVPFMLLLNTVAGAYGVVWGTPIAEAVGCVVAAIIYLLTFRKLRA